MKILVLATLFIALAGVAPAAAPLSWREATYPVAGLERRYRADAEVVILSLPLLHRKAVGGGWVKWRESPLPGGDSLRYLEFLGYSDPQRAAGLNRLGFIRELVRLSEGHMAENLYFGLMTSSPEQSAEEARKALHSTAAEANYSVIQGQAAGGDVTTSNARFAASTRLSAMQREELETLGRTALESAKPAIAETDGRRPLVPSFLEVLAELLPNPAANEGRYVYNGRYFRLWLRRAPDAKATRQFRERHMASAQVVCIAGKLRAESGGTEWDFRLWIEQDVPRPLPLRIEYQAKPYLRLVFEAEP